MGFLSRILPWRNRRAERNGHSARGVVLRRSCLERLEPRCVLSADPLFVGAVYIEEDLGSDAQGDTFEITFTGGAPGTELRRVVIDGDQNTPGFGLGDVFFDTVENSGYGADHAFPFTIVASDGIDRVTATVIDGTTQLILEFDGFHAGEKLVFWIDVDEVEDFDPAETDLDIINEGFDPITSGVEFQGSLFQVEFTAPHYRDAAGQAEFRNRYDDNFAGSGLNLPADDAGGKRDRTAGAIVPLQQIPQPVTIAGTVYHDADLDLTQDAGESGISGVTLSLWKKDGGAYVNTGHTTATDAQGDYRFGAALDLLPGVYQVRQSQPAGYFSVGAEPGSVAGSPTGAAVPGDPNLLTEIAIPLGGQHAVDFDFAEAQPARISGYVYHDRDNDGVREAGEEGIAGVQIQIVPIDVIAPQGAITVQTNADGFYQSPELAPGTYRVVELVQPAGFLDGRDSAGTVGGQVRGVAVNPGDAINEIYLGGNDTGVNYNFGELRPAEIHGSVTLSTPEGDCFVEGPERRPLAGVRIELFDAAGTRIAETTTNAGGDYAFLGLRPGLYRVVEHTPAGLIDGAERVGRVGGAERGALVGNDQIGGVALASGEVGVNYDFCEHEPAQISGFVFHDQNQSAVRDAGDEPIPGVTVTLYDDGGAQVAQTQTLADGSYAFTNLRAGRYRVVESHPAGWIDGPDAAGVIGGVTVGQAVNPGDEIRNVSLKWGDAGVRYNFGEYRPASISGYVYHDRDNDGLREAGEEGLPGVTVRVEPITVLSPQAPRTVTTDANGFYQVTGLAPGTYRVVEAVQPATFVDGLDSAGTVAGQTRGAAVNPGDEIGGVTLNTGESGIDYNFGEFRHAEIHGSVHLSTPEGDCFVEGVETPPLQGVVVRLFDSGGNQLAQTTTNAAGEYSFVGLLPGTYTVVEETPVGLIDGDEHVGRVGGSERGVIAGNDRIENIRLASGEVGEHYDFCEHEPASLSGYVYHDQNQNGVRDSGEAPIAGVAVRLVDAAGAVAATATTDADGFYQFANLRAGEYAIVQVHPAGWIDGRDSAGTIGGAVIGSAVNPGDEIRGVTLKWGDDGVNYNFGEYRPVALSGYVYHDRDNDGVRESGEEGISGVPVRIVPVNTLAAQAAVTVVTNADGFFEATGLSPGIYRVEELTQPASFVDGLDAAGTVNGVTRGTAVNPGDRIENIALHSGESGVNYNFGEYRAGAIRGRVHLSTPDGDCDFESNERRPLENVTVRLFDSGGALLAETTTNADGEYRFENLLPGVYTVVEETPAGLLDGDEHVGVIDGVVVGEIGGNDTIRGIRLSSGDVGEHYDFCEHEPASISGYVYHDRDNDGLREAGEEGLAGVAVQIVPIDALAPQQAVMVTTGANGFYRADNLLPGRYRIVQSEQPAGYEDGLDAAGTVNGQVRGAAVNPGDRIEDVVLKTGDAGVEYNFGEFRRGEIGGRVHLSTPDGDCDFDSEQRRPLENVTVRLFDSSGAFLAETTTNAAGEYRFTNLLPGVYTVVEETPAGLLDGDEHVGVIDGVTVGEIGGNDMIRGIRLGSGDVGEQYDFCEHEPASISGYVYHDRDNDGLRESGEEGLAGIAVQVVPVDALAPQQAVTVITGADGFYRADNLLPGRYRIVQPAQPAGYEDGLDAAGTVNGVIRGAAVNPGDRIDDVVLKTGDDGVEYNFGEFRPGEIHGRVHLTTPEGDCFGEGIETPPLENVTVRLHDAGGSLVAQTRTDADGEYRFTGLLPGTYTVIEETPAGLIDGGEHVGDLGGEVRGNDTIGGIVITSGQVGRGYDFCEHEPASISGFVYHDQNNNGLRDAGEQPIAGVTVTLADGAGQTVAQTETNAAGFYEFPGLRAGQYAVLESHPAGWLDGLDAAGTIDGVTVGAAVNPGDAINDVALRWGDDGVDYNFGEIRPASISGYVYHDRDNDGVRESGENGIGGVEMLISPMDAGSPQAPVTVFTGANGFYEAKGLLPGKYRIVQVVQPEGFEDGRDAAGTVAGQPSGQAINPGDRIEGITLAGGQSGVNYNFGEIQLGEIRGQVRLTTPDGDCFVEGVETPPVVGAEVRLFDAAGNLVQQTQTDADGQYRFAGLLPGRYTIVEETPVGLIDGDEHVGHLDGAEIGRLDGNDRITDILLGSGQLLVGYDFCEHEPASLSGFVYHDRDNDGRRDGGEEPIAGVTVVLRDAAGNEVARRETDSQGAYRFDGLRAGTYTVAEVQPAGWLDGLDAAGTIGGVSVGAADRPGDAIRNVVLKWGSEGVDYNFGELQPAIIEGVVHTDPDRDCVFDEDESPIVGVRIVLRDESGAAVAETITDAAGRYRFEGLAPGRYSVHQSQPEGFFNGDQKPGTTGGDGSVANVIANVPLASGQASHENNFCEVPPASLSGYVFQDGEAIVTDGGAVPENLWELRDGVFTPDDTPIPGVVMELRNGVNGEPIDAAAALPGQYPSGPIRTVTDAAGYYEFRGLAPGNYAVFQIHPDGFVDSIDTPGTLSGFVFNAGQTVPAFVIQTLSVDPRNDAVVRIILPSGADSRHNNFSEVRVQPSFVLLPPETLVASPALPVPQPAPAIAPAPLIPPPVLPPPPEVRFHGGGYGHTWHLSVVNGGAPREAGWLQPAGSSPWRPAGYHPAPQWIPQALQGGVWVFAGQEEDRITLQERRRDGVQHRLFGLKGAIPIVGDWDGDGVSEIGVFYNGQWFLDLNGNGQWDPEDLWAQLGHAGDIPVVGDWDGDGKDDIGIFGPMWGGDMRALRHEPGVPDAMNRPSLRPPHDRPKNVPPDPEEATDGQRQLQRTERGRRREDVIDHVFQYGSDRDTPVTGDWNGDGIATIGVFRDGEWTLDVDGDGVLTAADQTVRFGAKGDMPIVGDWNGDGVDDLGVFRDGRWRLDANGNREMDAHDKVFELGGPGDRPVAGDWSGDGVDEPAVYRDAPQEGGDRQ
jgi:serine-aspartate repeat-containing protein C/D/E